MRLWRVFGLLGFLLVAPAWADQPDSIGPDFEFLETSSKTLLVVRARYGDSADETHFLSVDIIERRFGKKSVVFERGGPQFPLRENSELGGAAARSGLLTMEIDPGDFAPTKLVVKGDPSGFQFCFSEGAPVYRLRPGKINVVDMPSLMLSALLNEQALAARDFDVLEKVSAIVENYPGITAEVVRPEIVAAVQFESSGGRKPRCPKNLKIKKLVNQGEQGQKP